jgi:cystathionine gamma-synthase
LAELEGGAAAAAFSSGSSATMTLLQAVGPGSHVILGEDAYFGTIKLARDVLGPWGLEVTTLDMSDLAAVQAAMRPNTKLVWIETPSNPLLQVADIVAVTTIAHRGGAVCAVDNTWGTPVLQRPLEIGADVAMHSTTKYLGGHSDVLSGALVFRENGDLAQRVNTIQMTGGAVPSPFDCWLVMRGIRTLPLRVNAQSASAMALAEFLAAHPRVEKVHYPGLSSHPAHDVARRQMASFGGMLSVQAGAGREEAIAIASRLALFTQATSLGGTESLIEHRASVEGPATRAPENLLRVSVGLEHVEDLKEDFDAALRG